MVDSQHSSAGHGEEILEHTHDYETAKRDMYLSIPFVVVSLFLMGWMLGAEYGVLGISPMSEMMHHLATRRILPLMATIVMVVIGRKYLKAVRSYLRYGKATMDTLVGIGTGFAYFYSLFVTFFGERFSTYIDPERVFYEAAIVVIGFISIGKYMEQRTMSKTGQAIKALVNLQVKRARVLKD